MSVIDLHRQFLQSHLLRILHYLFLTHYHSKIVDLPAPLGDNPNNSSLRKREI
jgi:hypothetical protein